MSKSKKINKKGLGTINRDKRNLDIFRYQLAIQVGIDKYSGQKIRKTKSITVDHLLNDKEKNHELTIFSLEAGKETRKLDHDKTYTIFHEYLANILAGFKGDVWMTFYEKGIFFTQENTDYSLTYYLATTAG